MRNAIVFAERIGVSPEQMLVSALDYAVGLVATNVGSATGAELSSRLLSMRRATREKRSGECPVWDDEELSELTLGKLQSCLGYCLFNDVLDLSAGFSNALQWAISKGDLLAGTETSSDSCARRRRRDAADVADVADIASEGTTTASTLSKRDWWQAPISEFQQVTYMALRCWCTDASCSTTRRRWAVGLSCPASLVERWQYNVLLDRADRWVETCTRSQRYAPTVWQDGGSGDDATMIGPWTVWQWIELCDINQGATLLRHYAHELATYVYVQSQRRPNALCVDVFTQSVSQAPLQECPVLNVLPCTNFDGEGCQLGPKCFAADQPQSVWMSDCHEAQRMLLVLDDDGQHNDEYGVIRYPRKSTCLDQAETGALGTCDEADVCDPSLRTPRVCPWGRNYDAITEVCDGPVYYTGSYTYDTRFVDHTSGGAWERAGHQFPVGWPLDLEDDLLALDNDSQHPDFVFHPHPGTPALSINPGTYQYISGAGLASKIVDANSARRSLVLERAFRMGTHLLCNKQKDTDTCGVDGHSHAACCFHWRQVLAGDNSRQQCNWGLGPSSYPGHTLPCYNPTHKQCMSSAKSESSTMCDLLTSLAPEVLAQGGSKDSTNDPYDDNAHNCNDGVNNLNAFDWYTSYAQSQSNSGFDTFFP
jgi:hypothetical protein